MRQVMTLLCSVLIAVSSCQSKKKQEKEQIVIGANKSQESVDFLKGKQLFKGKGNCYSCHRVAKKSIGPSITQIMNIYKEQQGDLIGFLKQEKDPIVDPENYAVMKTNFAVLKKFTEEELKAIELYMNEIVN